LPVKGSPAMVASVIKSKIIVFMNIDCLAAPRQRKECRKYK
jgi:hypothetical protein